MIDEIAALEQQVHYLQSLANQARGHLLEHPCNKIKCNLMLLRITQQKLATEKRTDLEIARAAIESAKQPHAAGTTEAFGGSGISKEAAEDIHKMKGGKIPQVNTVLRNTAPAAPSSERRKLACIGLNIDESYVPATRPTDEELVKMLVNKRVLLRPTAKRAVELLKPYLKAEG